MSMFCRSSSLMRSLVLLLLVSLAACSKDETGRYDGGLTPAPMLYGAVSKGPVEGAAVTVYRLNDDGTRGARLAGEFVTADDGSWS
ncbi:MAG TPA: hypothetical protein VIN71_05230, partial [Pseudomonadales bacterium]